MKILSIVSGGGGMGSTTIAINLALALRNYKRSVVLIDGNLKNPHIGLKIGAALVPITLNNALKGEHDILEATYSHPSGLIIIPASIAKSSYNIDTINIKEVLKKLEDKVELLIIDAGLDKNLIKISDDILLVTLPDIISVTDTLRAIDIIKEIKGNVMGIVVNKQENDKYDMTNENIEKMTGVKVITDFPEDGSIKEALYRKMPLIKLYPNNDFAKKISELAKTMI